MAAAKRASTAARRLRDRDTLRATLTEEELEGHQRQRDAFEIATHRDVLDREVEVLASTAARRLRDRDFRPAGGDATGAGAHQRQRDAFEIATSRFRLRPAWRRAHQRQRDAFEIATATDGSSSRAAPGRINGSATPSRSRPGACCLARATDINGNGGRTGHEQGHRHEADVSRPPTMRVHANDLIVDNFAGGGGASLGIEWALGRSPDIAVNHDPEAIAIHASNHPRTRHLCGDVWDVRPREDLLVLREQHARKADVLLRQAEGVNRVIYWLQTGAWPP